MSKKYWHPFDERMSDDEIRMAVQSIGLEVVEIIREAGVVFIPVDHRRCDEIRSVLRRVETMA